MSNFETNKISIIDPATDRILRTFPSGGDGPARLKFTRDGREVWVTHSRSNELMIYDAGEGRVLRTIPIGKFPKGLVILPDDEHGFVSVMDEDRVVEVEIPTGRVVASLNTGAAPEGLAWISAQPGWYRATKCHTPTE